MKLHYQTAIATLVQFATLSLLNIATGLNSIVATCTSSSHDTSDCLTNSLTSILIFLVTVAWFGFVWLLGYNAQKRRSKRLAQILIIAEGMICVVALFDIKHHSDVLSVITSVIDLGLGAWVIVLAFRLMRAKGGRIMASQRTRQRRHASGKTED